MSPPSSGSQLRGKGLAAHRGVEDQEGEGLVRQSGIAHIVVRFAGIYGPGRSSLIDRVRRGDSCRADPPLYTNRIHSDDCAAAMHHLITLDDPASLYLGVDDEPAPQCEVMDWIAGRLGVSAPPRASGSVIEGPRGNKRCRNKRLRDTGYRFRYPSFREGYAARLRGPTR